MAPWAKLSQHELDLVIAALILHDSCKSGMENSGNTVHEHPFLAAKLVVKSNPKNLTAVRIAALIATHMGVFTKSKYSKVKLIPPITKLQKFVSMCDMIAAQKWEGLLYRKED